MDDENGESTETDDATGVERGDSAKQKYWDEDKREIRKLTPQTR